MDAPRLAFVAGGTSASCRNLIERTVIRSAAAPDELHVPARGTLDDDAGRARAGATPAARSRKPEAACIILDDA